MKTAVTKRWIQECLFIVVPQCKQCKWSSKVDKQFMTHILLRMNLKGIMWSESSKTRVQTTWFHIRTDKTHPWEEINCEEISTVVGHGGWRFIGRGILELSVMMEILYIIFEVLVTWIYIHISTYIFIKPHQVLHLIPVHIAVYKFCLKMKKFCK